MSGKIYHYTDTAGLFGILNGSIWMTAVSYLNDSTEFDIGVMDIKDHLKKNFDSEVIAPNLIDDAFEEIKNGIFTVSFSRAPNQLSQWRGYCPQGGYCIEFKEREFSRLPGITFGDDAGIVAESGFKFAECRYDNHELLIKELKEKIEKRLRASRTGLMAMLPNEDVQKHLFFECIDEISDVLPFLKDKNFSEEKEVRLVKFLEGYGMRSFLAANCKFRTGKHYIIPYYELSGKFFNPSQYISKVIVGPGPHKERSAKSLDFFLEEMGMDIDIETSEIPLISW